MKSKYELLEYFAELKFTIGAEIGVAQGEFSESMFKAIPNLKLYCIDIWRPYHGNRLSGSWERNKNFKAIASQKLSKYNAVIINKMSLDAANDIPDNSLDFVFIDANHSFDYVIQDLIIWSKKVKTGGIVSGDDYYSTFRVQVPDAVDAYTKAHKITPNIIDPRPYGIRDRGMFEPPTYWWVKQ